MARLKEGMKAPAFEGTDQNGKKVSPGDYGVWNQKSLYGKTFPGTVRTTFIIDENGIIEKIISKVETKSHAEQILGIYK